jgi:uncharacterized protein YicC (UPF0701 family)
LKLNYFNYFTEIEDAFIRRRGKHLLVSPMDWALIESWKKMQVPLHVALRGIEKAFDSWESKPRKRTVKSLLYCQEEVEAQYAEWLESRVGANEEPAGDAGEAKQTGEGLPFSRAAILDHLRRGRSELIAARKKRMKTIADDFSDSLQRAQELLKDLEEEFETTASPDAQKLEQSLTGLERMLGDAIRLVGSEQLAAHEVEVKEQLKPYRKHMEPAVYQQTFDNLLMKRLREQFGVPRLSLFYL